MMWNSNLLKLPNVCFALSLICAAVRARRNVNIARGLRTSQSSTPFLPGIGISLTSSLAVDGNKDPNVNHGSCMSTNMSDANPWMSVDFGKPTIVTGFTITNAAMLTEEIPSSQVSSLYPYGTAQGDTLVAPNAGDGFNGDCNNGHVLVNVQPGFPFFNGVQTAIYLQVNGLITFGYTTSDSNPNQFPTGHDLIAVYWADVKEVCGGSRITGDIYYRVSTNATLLSKVTTDIQQAFSYSDSNLFTPVWALFVTWHTCMGARCYVG